MKARFMCVALFAVVLMLVGGCGGGSGGSGGSSDGGSGTLSVSVTDAKPVIPADPTEVWITFEEVRAHKSGGGWVTLPLPRKPLEINLMAFQGGATTHLVPPVLLDSGHYTQLRFEVSRAYMVIAGSAVEIDLDVPSGFLRIDKNFDFDVPDGEAVGLTVDFDLSQSIVDEGNGTYKLKPVLHLVQTDEAATIRGTIPTADFGNADEATVTVWWDKTANCTFDDPDDPEVLPDVADERYTKITVSKDEPNFEIFWLVPDASYFVQIKVGGNEFLLTVPGPDANGCQKVQADAIYDLGSANMQGTIAGTTFVDTLPAVVTVLFDPNGDGVDDNPPNDKHYATVTLVKPAAGDATFVIPVVSDRPYVVHVDLNADDAPDHQLAIPADQVSAGETFTFAI